jgi:hypothetical protein
MSDRNAPADSVTARDASAAEPGPTTQQAAQAALPAGGVPHAGARYAVLRLTMAVTTGGILYLFGLRGWLLLFLAVLISGVLSFFFFMRQREAAARNLEAMVEGRRSRHEHEPADGGSAAAPEPSEG